MGKNVILPILNKPIPVVADEYVDMEFGTGAVKITPAHDPNDFEVAQRHSLPVINVLTDDGHMNELAGEYAGMKAIEARGHSKRTGKERCAHQGGGVFSQCRRVLPLPHDGRAAYLGAVVRGYGQAGEACH